VDNTVLRIDYKYLFLEKGCTGSPKLLKTRMAVVPLLDTQHFAERSEQLQQELWAL